MDLKYHVGLLEIELYLPQSHSLKEKRRVIRRIKDRIPQRFKVAVAEVGYQDKWQRAALAVATVNVDYQVVNEVLNKVRQAIEMEIVGEAIITDARLDIS